MKKLLAGDAVQGAGLELVQYRIAAGRRGTRNHLNLLFDAPKLRFGLICDWNALRSDAPSALGEVKARYTMEPRPSDGGYEIMRDGERGLLPTGERVGKMFERWQQLQAVSPAVADAYLEGVTDGIKYEMT